MHTIRPLGIVAAGALLLSASAAFADDSIKLQPGMFPAPAAREMMRGNARGLRQATSTPRPDIESAFKNMERNFQSRAKMLRQDTAEKTEEATSSAERRDGLRNAFGERRAMMEDRREATTTMMKNRPSMTVLARQHIAEVTKRFAVALRQFDSLTARIQSRLGKLKAAGIDTSATDTLFASAQGAILHAKTDVQALNDLVAQVTDASDPKTVQGQVETAVKKAAASIKAAHDALGATTDSLVKIVRSQTPNPQATTTHQN